LLIPGISLLSEGVQVFAYFMSLVYLFLGIAIVSDIFMGSIEVITSQTKEIPYEDEDGTM
jgi:solute carrier family 8 (sodium/calcium exchanger)